MVVKHLHLRRLEFDFLWIFEESNFFIYLNYSDRVRHISASFRPIGGITTSLYTHIPVIRTANPINCKAWKGCHPMANETPHITNAINCRKSFYDQTYQKKSEKKWKNLNFLLNGQNLSLFKSFSTFFGLFGHKIFF